MKSMCIGLMSALLAAHAAHAGASFASLEGESLLDNKQVRVERYVLKPGDSTGSYAHRDNQLLVFVRGGVLKDVAGRSTQWSDGRVWWQESTERADAGFSNAGRTPVEIVCVHLKSSTKTPAGAAPHGPYLNYPNIPGEDLLENSYLVAQRFQVQPGQWEGVHAHHPNMLWIHIKGGQWAARTHAEPEHAYPRRSADGSVGWMDPIPLRAGHESRNIDTAPIDLIWVTIKP